MGLFKFINRKLLESSVKDGKDQELILRKNPDDVSKLQGIIDQKKKEGIKFHALGDTFNSYMEGDTGELHIGKKALNTSIPYHEIGHAEMMTGKKGKILQTLQKDLYTPSYNLSHHKAAKYVHGGAGFAAGLYNGSREDGKESKALKWSTRIAPLLTAAPVLITEGAASLGGYRMLKKAGVSKEFLKKARNLYLKAGGTYAVAPVKNIVSNEIGYQAGKIAGKQMRKRKERLRQESEE